MKRLKAWVLYLFKGITSRKSIHIHITKYQGHLCKIFMAMFESQNLVVQKCHSTCFRIGEQVSAKTPRKKLVCTRHFVNIYTTQVL